MPLYSFFQTARRVIDDLRGTVAVTFALSFIPVLFAVGSAVDYGRYLNSEQRLQAAADAVALMIAKDVENGVPIDTINRRLPGYFDTEMQVRRMENVDISFSYDPATYTVVVDASGDVPTTFMALAGVDLMPARTQSRVVNGGDYLEVALVLDNTGSMQNNNKLTELKKAAKKMIADLSATPTAQQGRAKVGIVPFGVTVNVGVLQTLAPWLGPIQTQRVCTGSGSRRVCVDQPLVWNGCVGDRVSPYTTTNAAPVSGSTLYPRNYDTCGLTTLMPLTSNFSSATSKIDAMVATGNTNIPIGLMWGWNMVTPGAPMSNAMRPEPTERVMRYIILLTDGDNTQNTLGSSRATIDTYTEETCNRVKAAGVTLFTIRVIDGNAALLRSCATAPSYYYDVNNASALTSVFQQILASIQRMRIAS